MTNAIKVGDTVDWADVPDGAMVRDDGRRLFTRVRNYGNTIHDPKWGPNSDVKSWREWCTAWSWGKGLPVTIIALGLTGSESAADLQRMVEAFDAAAKTAR